MHDFGLSVMMFAQETALPGAPGQAGTASGAGTAAPGSPGGLPGNASGGAAAQPFGSGFLTIFLVMVGAMLLFSLMGNKREKRKREAMISAIKKHDRVQTIGGVIGSVVEVKPDYVVLKVDESSNTRITFARSAVQQVLAPAPNTESSPGK